MTPITIIGEDGVVTLQLAAIPQDQAEAEVLSAKVEAVVNDARARMGLGPVDFVPRA